MVLHVLFLDKIPSTSSCNLGRDFGPMAGKYLSSHLRYHIVELGQFPATILEAARCFIASNNGNLPVVDNF